MSFEKPLIFGNPPAEVLQEAMPFLSRSENIFSAAMDDEALHDPVTLDKLVEAFPQNLVRDFDLFLMLAECMANAVSYNNIRLFGVHMRRRNRMLLVSVYHDPPIDHSVDVFLRNAHDGWLPDYESDPPSGLGFPILFRLAYQITVSPDRSRLQLWVRLRNNVVNQSVDEN